MNVPVRIKKLHPDAVIPVYANPGDAGFDLVAIEDVIIAPGETAKIRTGLAMAIPEGYEVQIRPRSGISSKTKLRMSNAPGTIDSGYRGDISILLENTFQRSKELTNNIELLDGKQGDLGISELFPIGTYLILKGDRIAQGVLKEVPTAIFEEVDELDETERGAGGFGHSGVTT